MFEPVWDNTEPDWDPIETRVERLLRAFRFEALTEKTLRRVKWLLIEHYIPVQSVEGFIGDSGGGIRVWLNDGMSIEWP